MEPRGPLARSQGTTIDHILIKFNYLSGVGTAQWYSAVLRGG
jgi:hypothetical protein